MGEETSNTMNLDLNLGPGPEARSGSMPTEVVNLDDWVDDPIDRIREAVRLRSRQRHRYRWRQVSIPPESRNLPMELDQLLSRSANANTLQTGEGSVAAEERTNELPKTCENNNGFLEEEVSEKKDDDEKGSGSDGSFFDCNICLDLSREPVVTCCGHLFCWPCLYRWLHVHSDAKECPVCKGEVTVKTVTPIYGRSNSTRDPEEDLSLKIPPRPQGRRVESLRQTIQRTALTYPVEEMIRRLGSRFDLARDLTPARDGIARETGDRASSLITRILTSRGIRAEQNTLAASADEVDVQSGPNAEGEARFLHSLLLRRHAQAHRTANLSSSISSTFSSTERLLEAYFRDLPERRNQEQPSPPVDDRDSFSSIVAVVNSESQIDTAAEIDSLVSLSTSSSRRRSENSMASDMDSGESRPPRRRRLN